MPERFKNNICNVNIWNQQDLKWFDSDLVTTDFLLQKYDVINMIAPYEAGLARLVDDRLREFAKNKELNIYIGCPDTKLWRSVRNYEIISHANYFFDSLFWIPRTYREFNLDDKNNFLNTLTYTPINKIFVSLNNQPYQWRCLLLDYLQKFDLIKYGAVSWHRFSDYKFEYWKQQKMLLDEAYPKKWDQYITIPKEYGNTFMNLISETTTEFIFITEKTATAIYAKKPFLIWGAPGIHKFLADNGFKLYTEIFDYSFDKVYNDKQRLEMILEQVAKLKNLNLDKLRAKILKKLEKNYKWACKIRKQWYINHKNFNLYTP